MVRLKTGQRPKWGFAMVKCKIKRLQKCCKMFYFTCYHGLMLAVYSVMHLTFLRQTPFSFKRYLHDHFGLYSLTGSTSVSMSMFTLAARPIIGLAARPIIGLAAKVNMLIDTDVEPVSEYRPKWSCKFVTLVRTTQKFDHSTIRRFLYINVVVNLPKFCV